MPNPTSMAIKKLRLLLISALAEKMPYNYIDNQWDIGRILIELNNFGVDVDLKLKASSEAKGRLNLEIFNESII